MVRLSLEGNKGRCRVCRRMVGLRRLGIQESRDMSLDLAGENSYFIFLSNQFEQILNINISPDHPPGCL